MKAGLRKPSVKRSLKARTTGKLKRRAKRSVNPLYGKRGMGFLLDPIRAISGWIYRRITVGIPQLLRAIFRR